MLSRIALSSLSRMFPFAGYCPVRYFPRNVPRAPGSGKQPDLPSPGELVKPPKRSKQEKEDSPPQAKSATADTDPSSQNGEADEPKKERKRRGRSGSKAQTHAQKKKPESNSPKEGSGEQTKEYNDAKETIEELYMAKTYYPIDKMPDFIIKAAQKVFSRYHIADVKRWGYLLKQNYQRLCSCENPGNIADIAPFANTSEASKNVKIVRDFKDSYNSALPLVENEGDDKSKSSPEPKVSNEQQIFNMEYGQAHAVAYLYKKLPHTYTILMRIMRELKQRSPDFLPLSCLDYGAGLGSGLLAAVETYPKISKVAACEPSNSMRKLGRFITKELKQDVLWVDSLTMIPGVGNDRGKFDLVVMSQVLEEIATPASRVAAIDALWGRVNDGIG